MFPVGHSGKEMTLVLSTFVSLPCAKDSILLSVGDKVTIPSDLWRYATETINNAERYDVWLSRDLPDPAITGVVRWLGTLPPISGTQLFAGIQTVSISYFYTFLLLLISQKLIIAKATAVCFFAIFCTTLIIVRLI